MKVVIPVLRIYVSLRFLRQSRPVHKSLNTAIFLSTSTLQPTLAPEQQGSMEYSVLGNTLSQIPNPEIANCKLQLRKSSCTPKSTVQYHTQTPSMDSSHAARKPLQQITSAKLSISQEAHEKACIAKQTQYSSDMRSARPMLYD